MKIPLLARWFGANYKTLLTGIGSALFTMITLISGLSYQLGDVATIIPPAWKARVFTVSIIAAFVLRVWNSVVQKDKDVHGGTIIQNAQGEAVANVPQGRT